MTKLWPNKSPEPTAVGAVSSAIAVHATSWRWLSFFRWPHHIMRLLPTTKPERLRCWLLPFKVYAIGGYVLYWVFRSWFHRFVFVDVFYYGVEGYLISFFILIGGGIFQARMGARQDACFSIGFAILALIAFYLLFPSGVIG